MNSPHKGQWRGALVFSLICAWIYDWVNNRKAGDLRRHHCHYDVNVMSSTHKNAWPNYRLYLQNQYQSIKYIIVHLLCFAGATNISDITIFVPWPHGCLGSISITDTRCPIVGFCEVSKLRNWPPGLIWHAHRQLCCEDTCHISK